MSYLQNMQREELDGPSRNLGMFGGCAMHKLQFSHLLRVLCNWPAWLAWLGESLKAVWPCTSYE